MNEILLYLREFNAASLFFRLTLAMISGGMLGLESGRKRRPDGGRNGHGTHLTARTAGRQTPTEQPADLD